MPIFEKLSPEEVQTLKTGRRPSKRQMIRQQYMDYLETLEPGEGAALVLEEGENRITARNRLASAAAGLRRKITFYRTRGLRIRFVLDELPKHEGEDEDNEEEDFDEYDDDNYHDDDDDDDEVEYRA